MERSSSSIILSWDMMTDQELNGRTNQPERWRGSDVGFYSGGLRKTEKWFGLDFKDCLH